MPKADVVPEFAQGFADAFGLADASACIADGKLSAEDLHLAAEEYMKGDWLDRAKALVNFGEGTKEVFEALEPCGATMADASDFKRLLGCVEDPRFYTVHNALILLLNIAEDRKQLSGFAAAWRAGLYRGAGQQLGSTVLDVLGRPGIPTSNGTASVLIARGIAEGFSGDLDNACFKAVRIEVPALVGGVLDIMTAVRIPAGLQSIFHGLTNIVPMFRACMADRPKIMALLHELGDLRHPAQLAQIVADDIRKNGIDLALETSAAMLDFFGKSWLRFGQDIGKILGKVLVRTTAATIVV